MKTTQESFVGQQISKFSKICKYGLFALNLVLEFGDITPMPGAVCSESVAEVSGTVKQRYHLNNFP